MEIINDLNSNKLVEFLKGGGVAVLPTDTLYGLHASALKESAVEKIYKLKKRNPSKPLIVLISSIKHLDVFNIKLDKKTKGFLKKHWPAKLSVVLPCRNEKFKYLHRGTNSLAFRLPDNKNLIELISKTGPLVSTTVNLEGEKPAETIKEAENIFGDKIKLYVDLGKLTSSSSTLIKLNKEKVEILRQGDVKI